MDTREKLSEVIAECAIPVIAASGRIMAHYAVKGDEAIHLADHLIANGVTIQRWIPVTERLPKRNKKVLIRSKMGTSGHFFSVAAACMVDSEFGWMFEDGFEAQDCIEVTHWMPLPAAPKGE